MTDDLRDVRDQILGEMRTGFDRTHARLDVLNGRVAKSETDIVENTVEIVKNTERIKTLFARLFERRSHERREEQETEKRPITRRDVGVFVLGMTSLLFVLKLLVWFGPGVKALTP